MNGILNVLKPPGMTSHDVVSYIRKVTGIKKVGHTGTLDPGAAGVLPICIGKATKVVDYIMEDKKTYICELTLGNSTDTFDKYGKFDRETNLDGTNVDRDTFYGVLNEFRGEIFQKPPVFSAIRINGVRSYELAREGKEVDMPLRKVFIYGLEVLKFTPPTILIKIICSKGTYIRSICNDIGTSLGLGGYMSFLLRTSTGNFKLENSITLDEITKDNIYSFLLNMDSALNMDSVYVNPNHTKKLVNGNPVDVNALGISGIEGEYKVFIKPNNFIGIGSIKGNMLKIEKLMI